MKPGNERERSLPMNRAASILMNVMLVPLGILFGVHVHIIATLAWQYLRIPYLVGVAALFAAEMALFDVFFAMPTLTLVGIVAATGISGMFCTRREWIEGPRHFEYMIPAHLLIVCVILFCLALPGLEEAILRNRRA
jgi:hypothetical protein